MRSEKGFAKFKPQRGEGGMTQEIEAGTLTLDPKVAKKVKSTLKKFRDTKRFGHNAISTPGEAIALMLEEFVYNSGKKGRK